LVSSECANAWINAGSKVKTPVSTGDFSLKRFWFSNIAPKLEVMGSLGFDLSFSFCLVFFIGDGAPLVVGFRFTHQSIF
jgi:hypothetical protein